MNYILGTNLNTFVRILISHFYFYFNIRSFLSFINLKSIFRINRIIGRFNALKRKALLIRNSTIIIERFVESWKILVKFIIRYKNLRGIKVNITIILKRIFININ